VWVSAHPAIRRRGKEWGSRRGTGQGGSLVEAPGGPASPTEAHRGPGRADAAAWRAYLIERRNPRVRPLSNVEDYAVPNAKWLERIGNVCLPPVRIDVKAFKDDDRGPDAFRNTPTSKGKRVAQRPRSDLIC